MIAHAEALAGHYVLRWEPHGLTPVRLGEGPVFRAGTPTESIAYEAKFARSGVSHHLTLERTGTQRPAISSALAGSKYFEMAFYESKAHARGVIVPRVPPSIMRQAQGREEVC